MGAPHIYDISHLRVNELSVLANNFTLQTKKPFVRTEIDFSNRSLIKKFLLKFQRVLS